MKVNKLLSKNDYQQLDDSYYEFEDYFFEDGYRAKFKENVKFEKGIKIILPSFYKGKEVKEFEFPLYFKNNYIVGVKISDTIKNISINCNNLKELYVGKNVEHISMLFLEKNKLEKIRVSKNNKVFDSRNNCNAIIETATNTLIKGCNKTIIPESVTKIGELAFDNCEKIKEIFLENNIESIGKDAFIRCLNLNEVFIGSGVKEIVDNPFISCNLKKIVVSKNNKIFNSKNDCNALIKTSNKKLICLAENGIIPKDTKSIGNYAFACFSDLVSANLPSSIKHIGKGAFSDCIELRSIKLPDGIKTIEEETFDHCLKLESINIHNSVTKIKYNAFNECRSLKSIFIPNSVSCIEENPFKNCEQLEEIIIDKNNKRFKSLNNKIVINLNKNEIISVSSNLKDEFIEVSSNVGPNAFYQQYNIKNIKFNENIKVKREAFFDCDNLESITLSKGVFFETYSFIECNNLTCIYDFDNTKNGDYGCLDCLEQIKIISINEEITENIRSLIAESYFSDLEIIIYKDTKYYYKDKIELGDDFKKYWHFRDDKMYFWSEEYFNGKLKMTSIMSFEEYKKRVEQSLIENNNCSLEGAKKEMEIYEDYLQEFYEEDNFTPETASFGMAIHFL